MAKWTTLNACALVTVLSALLAAGPSFAETGYDAWLRYQPIKGIPACKLYYALPKKLIALRDSPIGISARDELRRGVRGMLSKDLQIISKVDEDGAIVLATKAEFAKAFPKETSEGEFANLIPEAFAIKRIYLEDADCLVIIGGDDRGVLYGAFALLRTIGLQQPKDRWSRVEQPSHRSAFRITGTTSMAPSNGATPAIQSSGKMATSRRI